MSEPITIQKLIDADVDADTLGEFANEDKLVTSRLGAEYPSAPMASRLLVENGLLGATPFSTYAAMTASALVDGDYAVVTNDGDLGKNGVYQKLSGIFVYSKYNLQPQITAIETQLTSEKNSPLRNLYSDLKNPLTDVNVRLVGDSITWGTGASGTVESAPRNGNLTDIRNTVDAGVSPSWANLFRRYISQAYTDSQIVDAGNGVSYAEVTEVSIASRDIENYRFYDTNGVEVEKSLGIDITRDVSYVIGGETFDLVPATYPSGINGFGFDVRGGEFDLVHCRQGYGDANTYFAEVYVDDVLHQTISFSDTKLVTNVITPVILPDAKKHSIRIVNKSTNARAIKIQCIRRKKRITVCNDGIIGSTTLSWVNSVSIAQSINPLDDFVFVQLGTNDRIASSSKSEHNLTKNLRSIASTIDTITNESAGIILMSANAVTQNEDPLTSPYYITMRVVDATVNAVADSLGVDFISNYDATIDKKLSGVLFLADGLHPNDSGHKIIFENIKNAIINA